jgi:hypothetical protein
MNEGYVATVLTAWQNGVRGNAKMLDARTKKLAENSFNAEFGARRAQLSADLRSIVQNNHGRNRNGELIEVCARYVADVYALAASNLIKAATSTKLPYRSDLEATLHEAIDGMVGTRWETGPELGSQVGKAVPNPAAVLAQAIGTCIRAKTLARNKAKAELSHFVAALEAEQHAKRKEFSGMQALGIGEYIGLVGLAVAFLLWAFAPSPLLRVIACTVAFAILSFVVCQVFLQAWSLGPRATLVASVTLFAFSIAWATLIPSNTSIDSSMGRLSPPPATTAPMPHPRHSAPTRHHTPQPTAMPSPPPTFAPPPRVVETHASAATQEPTAAPKPTKAPTEEPTPRPTAPPSQVVYAPPAPVPTPPMANQTQTLLGLIQQAVAATGSHQWWLSAIFARGATAYDGLPGDGPMDYPAALKELAREGRVTILQEISNRAPYRGFMGPVTTDDIEFTVGNGTP